MIPPKRWKLYPQQEDVCTKLASKLSRSEIMAQLLLNRGVSSLDQAFYFLGDQSEPCNFSEDTLRACFELIMQTISNQKPILIYGDYDVDGMTSTAMMVTLLTTLGAVVRYKIPHRFDQGYGLNKDVVQLIQEGNVGLLITLDCGVTNVEEITFIKDKTKVPIIVMDHHQLPDVLPPFDVMLNPKELEPEHALFHLCTAGIVYKFVEYVSASHKEMDVKDFLDLAAVGTIADMATLQGENRFLVQQGLVQLSNRRHLGMRELLKKAGCERDFITTRDIGFVIAPRLNAAGRLSTAQYGVELLLSRDEQEAQAVVNKLDLMNNDRRAIEKDVFDTCVRIVEENTSCLEQSVLVFGNAGWHAGVIGITASKLVEKYHKPVVMVAFDGDIGRGSARTYGDVSIYHILKQCKSHFFKFGGHKQAAGFSMDPTVFDQFKCDLEAVAKRYIAKEQLVQTICIDMALPLSFITMDFVNEMAVLGPFGMGNQEPLFFSDQLSMVDCKSVGDGSHLKVTFVDPTTKQSFDAIGFGLSEKLPLLYKETISVVFSLAINEWNQKKNVQLVLKDIK